MGDSSMAIQVAPLPYVHEQGRSGPILGIDDRRAHGPVPMLNGTLGGQADTSPATSLDSSSDGSPNSHRTQSSDTTHVGKDDQRDLFEDAHNELLSSNDTQQTDQTILNDSEREERASISSHLDVPAVGGDSARAVAPDANGHAVQAAQHSSDGSPQLSSISGVSAVTVRPSEALVAQRDQRGQLRSADDARPPPSATVSTATNREVGNREAIQANEQPVPRVADSVKPANAQPHGQHGQPHRQSHEQSREQSQEQLREQPHGQPHGRGEHHAPLQKQHHDTVHDHPHEPLLHHQEKSWKHPKTQSNPTSASRAAAAAAELNDDVLVGTRVTEGHENFVTAYNMLTGIRVAVSRCTAKVNRPLTDADFKTTDEISFDLSGAGYNPSSKYMFRFKDYAPWVFRHLRDAFRLDPADYLMSLTAKYIVSELGSPGKSGSFFYYSRDYRFIIKTIRHAEHKLLRRILSQYYAHVTKYPDTLISQFYGLHRVRLPFGRKIHFVVMNNVFPALYEIHERYDLKGSLLGREYNANLTKPIIVYKDLDWLRRHKRVVLGPQKRERLVKQLEIDARFLERVNVMDYSLLVGIHDKSKGNAALNTLLRLKEFGPQGDQASKNEERHVAAAARGSSASHAPPHNAQHEFSELQMLLQKANPEQLKEFDFADEYRSEFYFYRDHGGFQSTNDQNEEQDVIYYIGIIDFLTGYTFRKNIETFCKSLVHDRKELSAVPAEEYGERFLRFLRGCIGPEIKSTKPGKRNTEQSTTTDHTNMDGSQPVGGAEQSNTERSPQAKPTKTKNGSQQQSVAPTQSVTSNQPAAPKQTAVSRKPVASKQVVAPRQRTMVKPRITSSHQTVGTGKPDPGAAHGVTSSNPYSSERTPQKQIKNGGLTTPRRDSSMDTIDRPSSSPPGVAVTSNRSPTVTSRKPTPPSSSARRPSVAVYGQNVKGKEG